MSVEMNKAGLVVNFHRERSLGLKTIRFVQAAVEMLERSGIRLSCHFVLDRPDDFTRQGIRRFASEIANSETLEVDFGNLGASRAAGVARVDEEIVFFLDGDDFVGFNWFERALKFFRDHQADGDKLIAHTEFFVGFDKEMFVRLGIDSRSSSFDPLSLAADWFFCNNLACHRSVFDAVPIEPYDHAGGFGAEDWHWSCETIARGYSHVVVPGTSYFYRGKPPKFSLGAHTELIPKKSSLFDPAWVNATAARAAEPVNTIEELPALEASFYDEADRLVPFDFGISYLRTMRTDPRKLRYFRPRITALAGSSIRHFYAGKKTVDNADMIFADFERVPGGIGEIDNILSGFDGPMACERKCNRLYILDSRYDRDPGSDAINVIWLCKLRAAGLSEAQLARLIARLFIQIADVRVFNFVSPQKRSLASSFAAAKRHTVSAWYNIILEYGFDYFSCTLTNIKNVLAEGVQAQTIAIFEKTARELAVKAGISVLHSPRLERIYANGEKQPETIFEGDTQIRPDAAGYGFFRSISPPEKPDAGGGRLRTVNGTWIEREQHRGMAAQATSYIYLTLGKAIPSAETLELMARLRIPDNPTIAIPALVVRRRSAGNLFFRPDVRRINQEIADGTFPVDMLQIPILGFDLETVDRMWKKHASCPEGRIRVAALLSEILHPPAGHKRTSVSLMGPTSLATCDEQDMHDLDIAQVTRELFQAYAERVMSSK